MTVPKPRDKVRDTAHSRVYAGLKFGLMNGDFIPGQRLVVRQLAEQFETSAMPVREALKQLVSDGALLDHPNRGVIVPEATIEAIADMVRVRCSIEGAATEWAATTITPVELAAIEELNRQVNDCMARGDTASYLTLNRKLHFSVYKAARSQAMQTIIERLWLRAGPWLNFLREGATVSVSTEHHTEILAGLRLGDGPRARRAVAGDISDAGDTIMRAISRPANGERRVPRKAGNLAKTPRL